MDTELKHGSTSCSCLSTPRTSCAGTTPLLQLTTRYPLWISPPNHAPSVLLRLEQQHRARQRPRHPRQRHRRTLPQSLPQVHVRFAALSLHQIKHCNILCMYVEQSYFARWWRLQSPRTRALVRLLVDAGQLSFANGGWCMHDEATPHYADMIDQMTLGLAP